MRDTPKKSGRVGTRIKKIINLINDDAADNAPPAAEKLPEGNWFSRQIRVGTVINSIIVAGTLGFIPGAWMIGLPIGMLYAVLKRESIRNAVTQFHQGIGSFVSELAETVGERVGDAFNNHPITVLRSLMVLAILVFSGVNSFSLIALYGLYAHTHREWIDLFKDKLEWGYSFVTGFVKGINNDGNFKKKMFKGALAFCILAAIISSSGIVGLPYSVFEMAITWIGFNAIFRDLKHVFKNPIKVFLENTGKIFGATWGRWLAYKVFKGKVTGSIGYPVGHLENNGLFSGIFSSFINPVGGFTTRNGFIDSLMAHFRTFLNSIFTSVFVTQEAHLHGDFYGTVGPTPLQVLAFIGMGMAVGYLVERAVYHVSNAMASDTVALAKEVTNKEAKNNARSAKIRWNMAYIAVSTPMILLSKGGLSIISMCGGSILAAGVATAGLSALALFAVQKGLDYVSSPNKPAVQEKPAKKGKNTQKPQADMPAAKPPKPILNQYQPKRFRVQPFKKAAAINVKPAKKPAKKR